MEDYLNRSNRELIDDMDSLKQQMSRIRESEKRYKIQLFESEEKYRVLVESAEDAIFTLSRDGVFCSINTHAAKAIGQKPANVIGKSLYDVFPESVAKQFHSSIKKIFETKESLIANDSVVPFNEELRWYNTTLVPLCDSNGMVMFVMGIARDVTARKTAEAALHKNRKFYTALVEDMPALICRFLLDGKLTFVNETYSEFFGKKQEELVGQSFFQFIPEENHEKIKKHLTSLKADNPTASYEHQVLTPSGETIWQRWTDRAVVFDQEGSPLEFQSVGMDITDQKKV